LGLAIVKHIVNRHRGHLVVESTLGEGSTFTVYLPAETSRQGILPGDGGAVAMPSQDVS
ncbi:MAG: ATP-binding protein, partial [Alphaproteobacteria bacterium]